MKPLAAVQREWARIAWPDGRAILAQLAAMLRDACAIAAPLRVKLAGAAMKVAAGTVLYATIIAISGLYPRAAGMMLTFPALNGLTLSFVARDRLAATAGIMFLIPVLNGVLCEFYIQIFRVFGARYPNLPLVLFAAISTIWILIASGLGFRQISVPSHRHVLYVVLCTAFLAICLVFASFGDTTQTAPVVAQAEALGFLRRNGLRVALFMAIILTIVLIADFKGSSARWLGPLGGFPLIAFFGVFTVADDLSKPIAARLEIMREMAATAWFGPVVAVWFIFLFSRYLAWRPRRDDPWDWARKVAAAAGGWALCLAFIAVSTYFIGRLR